VGAVIDRRQVEATADCRIGALIFSRGPVGLSGENRRRTLEAWLQAGRLGDVEL
jgi:hypothetical protein